MPTTPSITGGLDPRQVSGLQRSSALTRILHFETTMHRRQGNTRPMRYVRLFNYYSSQNLPPDNVEQPLNINLFKAICDKHTSYLWGQWQKDIVNMRVRPKKGSTPETDTSKVIKGWIDGLLDSNDKNSLLWRSSLNSSVYGDAFLRLRWNAVERRVAIDSILPEYVHLRWNVNNVDEITEVIVAYPIDRLDAQEQFGTSGNPAINYNLVNPEYLPGFGIYWEHWTTTSYRQWLDDVLIGQGKNPYSWVDADGNTWPGIIPFLHIPNMRIEGEFFGFSDAEMMLSMQDELNRRMSDFGDTINNHAHPIVTLKNYHGELEDLPVGPDALWDMGHDGEAKLLEWSGTPPAVEDYLNLLKQMIYDTSNMPEVAFGRSGRGGSGGGKSGGSSGVALQLALMPIVERATQKRIPWDMTMRRLVDMAAFITASQDPKMLPFNYLDMKRNYDITTVFATILPRDRMQVVNEQVALVNSFIRSRERALEEMGEENITDEEAKIKKDARFYASLGLVGKPQIGGKNSDRGNGGSPGNPGGPGAAQRKAGAPAKDA